MALRVHLIMYLMGGLNKISKRDSPPFFSSSSTTVRSLGDMPMSGYLPPLISRAHLSTATPPNPSHLINSTSTWYRSHLRRIICASQSSTDGVARIGDVAYLASDRSPSFPCVVLVAVEFAVEVALSSTPPRHGVVPVQEPKVGRHWQEADAVALVRLLRVVDHAPYGPHT